MLRLLCCVIILTGFVSFAWSESSGSGPVLTGVILDQTGAVIPNAEVRISSAKPGVNTTSRTDQQGAFLFRNLPIGTYNIGVIYESFSLYKSTIRIGTQSPLPLRITLNLAQLQQQVTVVGDAPQVNTDTAQNQDSLTVTTRGSTIYRSSTRIT